jgi:NADP-dependent 3-hydroxy acid dehydrogenase YdfG
MRLRYKDSGEECGFRGLNIHALSEVLTGDDSVYFKDLDVYLEKTCPPDWKDLRQAFKDKDIIVNNYNTTFREPLNEQERKQGYYE